MNELLSARFLFFLAVAQENFKSEDVGRHLLAAEDLTQQHHVFESQIAALGDNIQRLNRQTQQILQGADTAAVQREGPTLKIKIDDLNKDYDRYVVCVCLWLVSTIASRAWWPIIIGSNCV